MSFSSKKSSKAKKGDANIPNFVFKFDADAPSSPSLNFSASQPGSPAAGSSVGFNFRASSNPASPATTSFNFPAGSPASAPSQLFGNTSSPTTNVGFNFNSSSAAAGFGSAPSMVKRHASDINSLAAQSDHSGSLRRSTSEITFGASTPPATNATAFSFTPSVTPSTSAVSFNFNATAPVASISPFNAQNSANSFGSLVSATSHASATSAPATSSISFGSPNVGAKPTPTSAFGSNISNATGTNFTPASTNPASAFAPASTNPASAFAPASTNPASAFAPASTNPASAFAPASTNPASAFAPASTNPAPASTNPFSAFSFGSAPVNTSSSATPPIPATSGTSPFSLNKPASSVTGSTEKTTTATTTPTSAPSGLSFGARLTTPASLAASPASNGLGGFSFNKPTDTTKIPSTTTTTTSTFSFSTPAKASDDKSANSATSSFQFGAIKSSTSDATTTGAPSTFSFKPVTDATSSNTTTSGASTTTFATPKLSFGSDKDKKDESKPPVNSSSPFSFGTPAAAAASTTATTTTVDPNKPNPFSFVKVLDDLAKIAAQPPSQMYASLITPALAATIHQSQIVNHTSFRIDNIMSTTRFTELPEQAQKELDELEKYIKMESQRCEYIGKQKIPQHLHAMDKARKNTQVLSQQLDALSSILKLRMTNVEVLYDAVKGQLRHANDGCAVLEACKHPGNNARWLFGYSKDDDYFSQLARQLSGRVDEYKRCIWEVEKTAESWTQNKVQSPQDIADIMRNQNRAFIALSNKVASLHETVNAEKNYYYQYLKMYS